jgi:hypothetical protein
MVTRMTIRIRTQKNPNRLQSQSVSLSLSLLSFFSPLSLSPRCALSFPSLFFFSSGGTIPSLFFLCKALSFFLASDQLNNPLWCSHFITSLSANYPRCHLTPPISGWLVMTEMKSRPCALARRRNTLGRQWPLSLAKTPYGRTSPPPLVLPHLRPPNRARP